MKTQMNYITLMTLLVVGAIGFAQNAENSDIAITKFTPKNLEAHVEIQKGDNSPSRILAANELINYQAVALDGSGDPIANTAVAINIEIRNGAGGAAEFTETHNPTTDANGVFSIQVGSINPLDDVNWADIEAYLQVSLNGANMGETSIGSAATALHSKQSKQVMMFGSGTSNADQMIAQHSPDFPGWGIGYSDASDEVDFMSGGNKRLSIALGSGNLRTDGNVEVAATTTAPNLNTVYGNSMPIAFGSVALGFDDIQTGYGITSFSNPSTGVYDIVLDHDTDMSNSVVLVTPYTGTFGVPEIAGYFPTGPNSFTVRIQDVSGNPRDSAFTFVVYGNH